LCVSAFLQLNAAESIVANASSYSAGIEASVFNSFIYSGSRAFSQKFRPTNKPSGDIAYVQEIAGRTEQHWCPIKHAMSLKTRHSRYQHFLDYGDAEQYRKRLEEVRRDFADLKTLE
jgi:hypothetical protein